MSNESHEDLFAAWVTTTALKQFKASMSEADGKKAAARVTMAFLSAMAASKKPEAFKDVSAQSLAACITHSHDTGLYPGGHNPTVYLVPRGGQLRWEITHRGIAVLVARAGFGIQAVPVSTDDEIKIAYGEAYHHHSEPQAWPETLDDILGLIVVVRRIADGGMIARIWCPRGVVLQRKRIAGTDYVWKKWPIEMAQKTATKWAAARGFLPIDSRELQMALSADSRDFIDAEPETEAPHTAENVAAALGLEPQEAPDDHQLPDHGEIDTIDAEPAKEKETVKKRSAPKPRRSTTRNTEMP